jgi:hypothetical protein
MRRYPQTFHQSIFMLLFLVIFLLPLGEVCAQDYVTGAFLGQVVDSTGAPIPGVTIRVVNNETGVPAARQTDSNGNYRLGQLQPADYTITISKDGFVTQTMQRTLTTLKTTDVIPPVKLDTASVAVVTSAPTESPTPTPVTGNPQDAKTTKQVAKTTKQVVGATATPGIASEINTTDARRDGTYSEKEVSTLPLGGVTLTRSFDELGLLLPGVALPPQTQGSVAGPGVGAGVGSAGQFAVNGLRSRANNFTVDGSDNNDEDIGVRRQGFFALVPQPIESIREFQMITLLAPAQYGRNIGAQVNAVSKSGGNDTHGALFGLFNSSQLNSRNVFDTVGGNTVTPLRTGTQSVINCTSSINCFNGVGTPITSRLNNGGDDSFTLGQGGGVIGGPLVPGKLFYFFSAEGTLLNANKEESFAVPTIPQRGLFNSGASGLFITPFHDINGVFPIGSPNFFFPTAVGGDAIFSLFPFPNNPNGVYGANTFTQQLPAGAQGKIISGKVDAVGRWRGRDQSFTARYNFTQDWRDIPVTGGGIFSSLRPRVRTQNFSTFWNSELSDPDSTHPIFNQLRASYGRTRLIFDERRDTEFLLPTQQNFTNPSERNFLLNARLLSNFSLPDAFGVPNSFPVAYCAVCLPGVNTTEDQLGPVGQVNIAGFSPVGVDVFNFPQRRVNNTYQLADTLSWNRGTHNLTFGADIRRTELISDLPRNSRPLITFNGTPRLLFDFDLATGNTSNFRFDGFLNPTDVAASEAPTGFFQSFQLPGTSSYLNLRYYQYNFFGQDQWRIRPTLSLSFGLRYEYNTPPTSANDQLERTFNSSQLSLVPALRTFIEGRTGIFDPDKNNFAPRIGVAWSPRWFGNRSTVVRGGYGLFYDQILGAVVSQSRNVFPNVITANLAGGGFSGFFDIVNPTDPGLALVRPNTLNTLDLSLFTLQQQIQFLQLLGDSPFSTGVSGISTTLPDRQLEIPMAHHYSVTIEQQLSRSMVFSAGYVGTQGRNLLRLTTPNLGQNAILTPLFTDALSAIPNILGAVLAPGARVSTTGNVSGGRPTSGLGPVTIFETTANSRYDALQLQLRGRYNFLGATQFQVNYTYGKVDDDVSDVFDLAGASALPQNSLTFAGERGPANFDVRHRISSNYIADFSSWGKKNSSLHAIFNELEVAGTGVFQTGQPFTVNSIFDVNLDGNLTDRLNTMNGIVETDDRSQPLRLTAPAASLLAPIGQDGAVPRNSFRSSNLFLTNVAVIKKFSFSESTKLVFRTEFFNLFNRANYGIPVRYLEAPGFGKSTDTITPGRRIQFGLKLLF